MNDPTKTPSIQMRLLAATLIILPLFLGLTAWVLDRAFASYQLESQKESLRLQQLLLAKAIDWDGAKWVLDGLDEPRLGLPNSGLYALVLSPEGNMLWRSGSTVQIGDLEDPAAAIAVMARALGVYATGIGGNRLVECALGADYFCQSTRVAWGSAGPEIIFLIIESQSRIVLARSAYRRYLLWLSLGVSLLLLVAQSLVIHWGLAPLRSIATDINLLERGEKDHLDGSAPGELIPLTDGINILLASEKRRRERVRNTMDRLTHVLKTPLMLIRNSTESDQAFRSLAQEQVTRMLGIVEGELAKARLDGRAVDILGKPVSVRPVLQRIVDAYRRLPRCGPDVREEGELDIDTRQISSAVVFHGEERDLQDLFGSILENTLKYCRHRIVVSAQIEVDSGRDCLVLSIGDDGDGIPTGYEREVLRRGARADTANVGQGIGLSIVVEIVSAYGGSLHIESSPLGGALFVVRLPGPSTHRG